MHFALLSQLAKRKDFTEGTVYKLLGEDVAGVTGSLSLQQYQDISDRDMKIQELRQCRLSEAEIQFKLQHEQDNTDDRVRINMMDQ